MDEKSRQWSGGSWEVSAGRGGHTGDADEGSGRAAVQESLVCIRCGTKGCHQTSLVVPVGDQHQGGSKALVEQPAPGRAPRRPVLLPPVKLAEDGL